MNTRFLIAFAAAICANAAFAATDVSWVAAEMSQSGDAVVTDGTLVYAYCQSNGGRSVTNTVNGVPFAGLQDISPSGDFCFTNNWNWYLNDGKSVPPAGLPAACSNLLAHGWWAGAGEQTLQLKNLTPGSTYQVQVILYNSDHSWGGAPGYTTMYAPGGDSVFVDADEGFGGSLIGTFTARNQVEAFTLTYENGNAFLNALQVREIATGGQAPVNPSVESVSATPGVRRVAISLAGVVMGTDASCNPAAYYTVSYRLYKGSDPVRDVDLSGRQTGTAVSFTIANLDEGDYVCEATITTDKEKTASATVAFTILPAGDFDALKAAVEGASAGDTVQVAKGYYTATSTINATAADLKIVAQDANGKAVTILDGGSSNRMLRVSGAGTVVQGVTFKNGGNSQGGAIKLDGDALRTAKILDCDFIECTGKYGGAIFANDTSHADYDAPSAYGLVRGCTFVRCGTPWNGDMWNAGGAIYGSLWVENSAFDACYTDPTASRGQTSVAATSHMTVSNCVFRNQTIRQYGGGLVGTAFDLQNNNCGNAAVRLVGCTICDNVVESPTAGLFYDRVWIDRCTISGNSTPVTSSLVPLFRAADSAFCKVTSTLFVDNGFPFKLNRNSMPALYNCTFVRNVGGLAFDMDDSSRPVITNCVFWGNVEKTSWPFNTKYKGAPGLYYHPGGTPLPDLIRLGNTVVEGGSGNEDMAAVLAADVSGESARLTALADADDGKGIRFADSANGDWRPISRSPLVNTGVLCDWMAGAFDLAGRPRVFDGAPDIGCHEKFGDPPSVMVLR